MRTDRDSGCIVVNADDWGRDSKTTQRALECIWKGSVSSVSAMVYMADSHRAADVAADNSIDAGLHLNLTDEFTDEAAPQSLRSHHEKIARYLRSGRFAQCLFHPGLTQSFEYVVRAQLDEFTRRYGAPPQRIDGHHHMHLCSNVAASSLLPRGTVVRRNFSFRPGEKSLANRLYRKAQDRLVGRRHYLMDYFFSIQPIEAKRLEDIMALGRHSLVEIETHPINRDEYETLTSGDLSRWAERGLVEAGYTRHALGTH